MQCKGFIVIIAVMVQLFTSAQVYAVGASESKGRTYTAIGARSCKKWLKDEADSKSVSQGANGLAFISDEDWLVGFLSGANSVMFGKQDYLANLDLETVTDWVDVYCQKNQEKNVADVALELLAKLNGVERGKEN